MHHSIGNDPPDTDRYQESNQCQGQTVVQHMLKQGKIAFTFVSGMIITLQDKVPNKVSPENSYDGYD
jgi:hypothetical protein